MASVHKLEGLLKWVHRDEWRDVFEAVLDQHIGSVCAEYEIDPDDIAGLIGAQHFTTLWGCAFEDLLSLDLDGRNITDDYLKRRKWKESPGNRDYFRGLRDSYMSLYEVSGIERDRGFYLSDMITGGEPEWVWEKTGTAYLAERDVVGARLVRMRSRTTLAGGLLLFQRETADALIAMVHRLAQAQPDDILEAAREMATEMGEDITLSKDDLAAFTSTVSIEEIRARSAFLFSSFWLRDALDRALGTDTPELVNTDGDPIEWIEAAYPLAKGVRKASVARKLDACPELASDGEDAWDWIDSGKSAALARQEGTQVLTSRRQDGRAVLGTVELHGRKLIVQVNSGQRLERARALVEGLLANALQDPEILPLGSNPEGFEALGSDLSDEETEAALTAFYDSHYQALLDEAIPMLGDRSPRESIKTEAGRTETAKWLMMHEEHLAHMARSGQGPSYDIGWVWAELGLERPT